MSYNLFLDDIRQPTACCNYIYPVQNRPLYYQKEWTIVRNYEEFVQMIEKQGLPELISFDHDLADVHYDPDARRETFEYKEKTGYECAKWLIEYCTNKNLVLPEFLIHSQNPIGAENIKLLLLNFKNHQRGTKT